MGQGQGYPMITYTIWRFSCAIGSQEFDFFSFFLPKRYWHPLFSRTVYFTFDVIYFILKKNDLKIEFDIPV